MLLKMYRLFQFLVQTIVNCIFETNFNLKSVKFSVIYFLFSKLLNYFIFTKLSNETIYLLYKYNINTF